MERRHKPCPRTPGKVRSEVEVLRRRIAKAERRLKRGGSAEMVAHEMDVMLRMVNRLEELKEEMK